MQQTDRGFGRRLFIGAGLGVVGLGLASCRSEGPASENVAGEGLMPDHVPFEVGDPDLPAGDGIPAGYFHYPENPPEILTGPAASGGRITALLQADQMPVSRDRNPWLLQIEEHLGAELHITGVPSGDYLDRLNVTIAGGDLPDMLQFSRNVPDLPQILSGECVDLADYLGGDKVNDYPALAALPPTAWTSGMVNGRLFGVGQPRSRSGQTLTARADLIEEMGLDLNDITDGESFLDFCGEVSDGGSRTWAFGQDPRSWLVTTIAEMTGAPNGWRVEDDGTFTRDVETEEYEQALEVVREMWDLGYLHPDSFSAPSLDWWTGGQLIFYRQAFEGWTRQYLSNPEMDIAAFAVPQWEGGGSAAKHLGPGHYADFVAIKQGDDDRIEEMLGVLNVLAAPFGSREYLDVNFGVEGDHYELDGTDPEPLPGAADYKSASLLYVGGPEFTTLYIPGAEDLVRRQHEFLSEVVPSGMSNPSVGLFSDTNSSRGLVENQQLEDLQNEIIQGRTPVSAFSEAVEAWRTSVGDEIREELAEAAAQAE